MTLPSRIWSMVWAFAPDDHRREMVRDIAREVEALIQGEHMTDQTPPSKRGGPRPGFGGPQPGSGRKPKPVTDRPVAISLDPDTARRLDDARGETSRKDFIRGLLAACVCQYCDSARCSCRPCNDCGEFPERCTC